MEINEIFCVLMFVSFFGLLLTGFPIAWVLGGIAVLFTFAGDIALNHSDLFQSTFYQVDWSYFSAIVDRIWDIMENWVLVAMPLFIFMGLLLDKSGVVDTLMQNMSLLFGRVRGDLAVVVAVIGIMLAASTGIIGASVVLLATIGLPAMLDRGYRPEYATGVICSIGTLGILIPPSIMLVLMADRMALPVGDLFMGALVPGLMLGGMYIVYLVIKAYRIPAVAPLSDENIEIGLGAVAKTVLAILPTSALIFGVLGSIFWGIATPTEAAGIGAVGTMLLAFANGRLSWSVLFEVCERTLRTTAFILAIFLGATAFSLVLRGFGGDEFIGASLRGLPFGPDGVVITILAVTFLLGFFLDWIEIVLIILPLVSPVVTGFGFDPVWFTVLFAVCLQTSFLTPPMGFALFYLEGVSPNGVTMRHIYKGIVPYIGIQILGLSLVFRFPELVTWLPSITY
ncbi:TRAP transporter large permease subunit [Roseovarius sp. CAU 1744]|uniref:TRAP transporter large permease n=1 Tax=Roseovarius sp. CAU 1744 TaxID=3140368 RepID=UPI00325ADFB0